METTIPVIIYWITEVCMYTLHLHSQILPEISAVVSCCSLMCVVDVNWKNRMEDGATALIAATKHKHTRIVRLLLYHKASPAKISMSSHASQYYLS